MSHQLHDVQNIFLQNGNVEEAINEYMPIFKEVSALIAMPWEEDNIFGVLPMDEFTKRMERRSEEDGELTIYQASENITFELNDRHIKIIFKDKVARVIIHHQGWRSFKEELLDLRESSS